MNIPDKVPLSSAWMLATMVLVSCVHEAETGEEADIQFLRDNYTKREYRVPMRDGEHLFTAVYVPNDSSRSYPFLVKRTPYTVSPYGEDQYPRWLGPVGSRRFAEEGYIFVYQDVRGRYMSEGVFRNMTPHAVEKDGPEDVDESTDMYDTVEWLLDNVQHSNGRVGIWGISYPGFYTAASIINTHPAIKAASPQAAIGDWFVGDDFHHKGAFYLLDAWGFFPSFKSNRGPNPTTAAGEGFEFPTSSAYDFFRDLGPIRNANERYFHHEVAFWDSMITHGTYDQFWQSRNIIPHMHDVTAAVMTVAGWYDAEDPYGPIQIYRSIEEQNPGIQNTLVAGPWFHGGWVRSAGDRLGNVSFGVSTGEYYRENIDIAFFNYHLKDEGELDLPEALVFASGSNEWHRFDAWPPSASNPTSLYFGRDGALTFEPPLETSGADSYVSDPSNPVPYTQEVTTERTREYMVEDQRFVANRADVLVYQSDILAEDFTFAGPLSAEFFVSTTGTDADFVVKLIDVFPDDAPPIEDPYLDVPMGGYQMLVRGEVMRAKFRNGWETPAALTPGEVTRIRFDAPDIFHTFKTGHRIMVQIQSSWFPLVDMNPQMFVDIYDATEADFQVATHTLHRSADHPSRLVVGRIRD